MKDQVIRIAILIVSIILGLLVWQGIMSVGSSTQSLDRTSYVRIAKKSCVDEATKYDGVTNAQANQYCQCFIDRAYAGKTVEDMRKMDAEIINGVLPAKYDQLVIDCANTALN